MAAYGKDLARAGKLAPPSPEHIGPILAFATDALPLKVIHDRVRQPFMHGCAAGLLLLRAATHASIPQHFKLSDIKHDIAGTFTVSVSTVDNTIWPAFRPVAHLFAAYLVRALEGETTFPCRLVELPLFLARAEDFRSRGEAIFPPRRSDPMLRPGEALTFGVPFPLPPSDLRPFQQPLE